MSCNCGLTALSCQILPHCYFRCRWSLDLLSAARVPHTCTLKSSKWRASPPVHCLFSARIHNTTRGQHVRPPAAALTPTLSSPAGKRALAATAATRMRRRRGN